MRQPLQLYRIQKAKEYRNHPLKKEYEEKKSKIIKKNKGAIYYSGWAILIFSWIMVIGYLVIWNIASDFSTDAGFIAFLFGSLNLIIAVFGPLVIPDKIKAVQKGRNQDELKKLINEYEKKGLYEMTEEDLVYRCLDENYNGDPICGVTGADIGYGQKYYFCKQPRNCLKCKTFMKAYLGEDWHGEYEME